MALHRKCLSLESLERREVFSATVLEVEVNDTKAQSNAFALDAADHTAVLVGTSASDDDKDFFVFTSPMAGTLNVAVSASTGNVAQLEIEDPLGNDLFESEPNDGINSGSVQVSAGQRLFVRLRSTDDNAAAYSAALSFNTIPDDPGPGGRTVVEAEANNRKSQANRFTLDQGSSVLLQGVSQSDRDKDFFAFTPAANSDVTVQVRTTNNNFPGLQIETAQGWTVLETQPNDGVNSGSVTLAGGTTYYIRLRSKNAAPAAYEVDLALSDATGVPTNVPPQMGSVNDDGPGSGRGAGNDDGRNSVPCPSHQGTDLALTRTIRPAFGASSIGNRAEWLTGSDRTGNQRSAIDRVFAEY